MKFYFCKASVFTWHHRLRLVKNGHFTTLRLITLTNAISYLLSCLPPLLIFYIFLPLPSVASFAMAGFPFRFPEEPPPRPPQPAVLIKSKCGLPQQLFTHCSCPLCSSPQSSIPLFLCVVFVSSFHVVVFSIHLPPLHPSNRCGVILLCTTGLT